MIDDNDDGNDDDGQHDDDDDDDDKDEDDSRGVHTVGVRTSIDFVRTVLCTVHLYCPIEFFFICF
jgi:hypothetical protein